MRVIVLFLLVMTAGFGLAQETVIQLKPSVRDDNSGKSLGGATIEVYKNGSLFAKESSGSNGKAPSIDLPVCIGCTYTVKIKKSGYVTKTAIVDGHSDYPEELPPGTVVQKFDVSIFESVEGIDFSFLDREPMIEFAIDSYGMIGYDQKKVKAMLKKIENLKKQMEEKKEQLEKEEKEKEKREADFMAYIKAGDAAVSKKEYEKGIGQYELALALKPDDQPTKDKIANAKQRLEEERANALKDQEFSAAMAAGKEDYSNEKLQEALEHYREAALIKPNEKLPKDLIAEIEAKIAEQQKNEEAFKNLVAAGDAAASAETYDEAIQKYEEALKLKKDADVERKLADVRKKKADKESALAEEKALQKKYDDLIAQADAAMDTEKFEEAKKSYEEALKIKPDENKPKDKIAEIDQILKERADELAKQEKLEADYNKAIADAKEAFDKREWENAKAKYEEALKLKPNDDFSLAQIDLINKEISAEADAAKKDEEYSQLLEEAKNLLDQKKYQEAKSKYAEAGGIKPQEQLPKDKVAEIEQLLADAEKAAQLEADYNAFMTEGDALEGNKDYTAAVDRYNKALEIKPNDPSATAKIEAINKIIAEENAAKAKKEEFDKLVATAEEAFNAKEYDKAKLNYTNALAIQDDPALKTKIKEIDELIAETQSAAETQAKYDAAIKEADALYAANDDKAALEKYKEAFAIKNETYPQEKISELNEKITAAEAAEAKEKEFNDLVAEADGLYANEKYSEALAKYKEAINVKPDPSLTEKIAAITTQLKEMSQNAEQKANYDAKIAEADAAFADENWEAARELYKDAGRILPTETYPDNQIKEIEKRMAEESAAETEKNYQKIITKADQLRDESKFDDAIGYYNRALSLKPSDPYPQNEIDKIEEKRKQDASAAADLEKQNAEYEAHIKDGDEAFNADNWTVALEKYQAALNLKPQESYPQNRIAEIQTKLNDADAQRLLDEKYTGFLKEADRLFDAKEYQEAKKYYNQALDVKPNEQYPKDKIASADNFLRLETENEVEEAYQKMLTTAQENFENKNYERALELYLRAKTTKPTDPLPQQRIDEINQIILKAKDEEALREQYDDYIKEADYQYEKGNWKEAKSSYTSAYNLFNEDYPERRIKECTEAMKAATEDEVNKNYNKIIAKADEYFTKKNYDKAKNLYNRAIGIKPSDQYPKDQLKEIDKLLNPTKYANNTTNSNGLKDYGQPNRSVNAIDIDAMLADAEEQRKFITTQKTEQQRLDAEKAGAVSDDQQTDANFDTRNEVVKLRDRYEKTDDLAEEQRVEANEMVVDSQDDLVEVDRYRTEGNDNAIQRQNQIVANINREISERDDENDLPREEYEADVERIRSEIIVESQLETNQQTNDVFDQRNYVEQYNENRIEVDPNYDIDRKNTEVHVEDFNIELINASNHDTWDQEDATMDTRERSIDLREEQDNKWKDGDMKRVEGHGRIEKEHQDRIDVNQVRNNNQYDVTVEQKEYAESVMDEIEIENMNNDIPRMNMEEFVEKQILESNDKTEDLSNEQTNQVFATESLAEELELEQEERRVSDNKKREGYELIVDEFKEENEEFKADNNGASENEMHETVNYLEDYNTEHRNLNKTADEKSDGSIDQAAEMVEEMQNENADLDEKSKVDLENSEDFVESLRDINPNEVDEKMKNSLGSQFPEGVTEEIYTINDEDGLISSYIVRRVVVRNGVGDVYEKVQTKFGTSSYMMNGQPITAYDWQDQTEAADLVRN